MTLRQTISTVVVLGSLLLLAGCRTPWSGAASGKAPTKSDKSLEQRAAAHAHYAQAVIYESAGQGDEALEEYHQAARLDPANEQLVVEVSRRWLRDKKSDRALELLKISAAQPGATAMMDVLLGNAYTQLGKTNLAIEANQRAIRKAPHLLAGHQNLCLGYLQDGQPAAAVKVLDTAAKTKDADGEFLIGLAELYVNLGAAVPGLKTNLEPKALNLLNRVQPTTLTNVQSRVRLADGYFVLGESDKAASQYQALLEEFPQTPLLQENLRAKLTDIYLRGKDRRRAVEQLEVITQQDPLNVQAHYYLAMLAAELGDAPKAEEHYRAVVVLNPKFEQAYYDLAVAELSSGKTNEALLTLKTAQKKFNVNFVSEFLLGAAYSSAGNYSEAVRRYTSAEIIARATEPKRLTAQFYFQVGAALSQNGDYSESVKYLQKALELKPDYPEAANHLGYMWAERGENLERAKALIELAVNADPKNNAYLDSLAWVLFKLGKAREALPIMEQAVVIAEREKELDATLYDHLGDIQAALGKTAEARATWRKALTLGPNDDIRKKLESPPKP